MTTIASNTLILGAVYIDRDGDGRVDPGEGQAGVGVTLKGMSPEVMTTSTGGYGISGAIEDEESLDLTVEIGLGDVTHEARVTRGSGPVVLNVVDGDTVEATGNLEIRPSRTAASWARPRSSPAMRPPTASRATQPPTPSRPMPEPTKSWAAPARTASGAA